MVVPPPVADGLLLAVGVAALWAGARLLVGSSVRLARRVGLSELVIGLTVVAVGTSSPEIVVTVGAAVDGAGDLAVGNVIGSNLYNLAVVLGAVAVVGPFAVEPRIVRREGVALVAATLAGALAVSDLRITPAEGGALLALLVGYIAVSLRAGIGDGRADADARTEDEALADGDARSVADASAGGDAPTDGGIVGRPSGTDPVDLSTPARRVADGPARDLLLVVVGVAVVVAGGDLLVDSAVRLARTAGVSEWVIGGTVVAAGTSTPEFAVSLVAVRQGSLGVSVGNVVGSSVFNVLGVLGLAALLTPLSVAPEALVSVGWLVVVTVAVVAALWSGRRLTRPEGIVLALSEALRWTLSLLRIV
ncbi:sodium:calcium antiporter [Halobaculum magnesiiphilum]|uniref:Sodium:calcium antiporter n=1 Tax=Halobaculum magnesiiphilum TaxID=1017351 RepID=A0A8T8WEX8_9EURY|nr:sodium:calcium antiporter [Halobaculum magnesiiphilum]QZP38408.1 sodium:calcium antiporter [Halobaculum magnesiiphilum]